MRKFQTKRGKFLFEVRTTYQCMHPNNTNRTEVFAFKIKWILPGLYVDYITNRDKKIGEKQEKL